MREVESGGLVGNFLGPQKIGLMNGKLPRTSVLLGPTPNKLNKSPAECFRKGKH